MTLFHDNVIVAPLGSGSRGNCTYVGTDSRGVLVDCGLSARQTLSRLAELGLEDVEITAVLITHEHTDHVGAAGILSRRLFKDQGKRVPFYMTRGTERCLNPKVRPDRIEQVRSGRPFRLGTIQIEPFTIPHDTLDPVAYVVCIGGVRAGIVTDLGRSTRLVERQFSSLDIALLEFNHDVGMLMDGEYPWSLKQRVRGNHGHLSNQQAAELLRNGASKRLKHLILGHLSQDNNTPELALEAAGEGLRASECSGVSVQVASQQVPLGPFRVRTPRTFRPGTRSRTRPLRADPMQASPEEDPSRQGSLF